MQDVIYQILEGNNFIQSLMVESNINWGNQFIFENLDDLQYGVLVIDVCIDWFIIEKVICEMCEKLKDVFLVCKVG